MRLVDKVLKLFLSNRSLQGLSDEQNLAVIDLLSAMVLADGKVSGDEVRVLNGELLRLPWAWSMERSAVEDRVRASQRRLGECTADERAEAVRAAARSLPEGAVRELVARMMIELAYADGVEDLERTLLGTYGREAGISDADMKALFRRVERDLSGF